MITEAGADAVATVCKGFGVMTDGSCGSYTYVDRLRRQDGGWRIAYRRIKRNDDPLGGLRAG